MQIVSKWIICLKGQSLFSEKNEKNTFNLSSAEFSQRVTKVKVNIKCRSFENLYHFLGKFSRRQNRDIFLIFQKSGFDSSCKLDWRQFAWNVKSCFLEKKIETVCLKCQSLFSGEKIRKQFSMSSAEFLVQIVKWDLKTVLIEKVPYMWLSKFSDCTLCVVLWWRVH